MDSASPNPSCRLADAHLISGHCIYRWDLATRLPAQGLSGMKEGHRMRFQGPRPAILPRSCPGARALASMEAGAEGVWG